MFIETDWVQETCDTGGNESSTLFSLSINIRSLEVFCKDQCHKSKLNALWGCCGWLFPYARFRKLHQTHFTFNHYVVIVKQKSGNGNQKIIFPPCRKNTPQFWILTSNRLLRFGTKALKRKFQCIIVCLSQKLLNRLCQLYIHFDTYKNNSNTRFLSK